MILKLNPNLTSIFLRGPVNSSNPNFKKAMTNLLVVWKIIEKAATISIWCRFHVMAQYICQLRVLAISIWQKQWQSYMLLRNPIKNCRNNFYLHPKSFKTKHISGFSFTLWPGISVVAQYICGMVIQPMPTFCNIDMTQTMAYWCLQKSVAYYGSRMLLEN